MKVRRSPSTKRVAQKLWIARWQPLVFRSITLILLISILIGGQSLHQQMRTQDKSLEISLVRGVHDFNQLQREVNRLRLLIGANDGSAIAKDLGLQLNITQSRFTIIQRQHLSYNIDTQVTILKTDLNQAWLSLKPKIQRWQLEPANPQLRTQIMDQLGQLELDINQVSILHQRQQWRQYQSLLRRRSRSSQLLSIIAFLFCGLTLLVGYSLMQFIRTRQRLLEELEQLATVDDLTQIANRRYFNTVFEKECQRMVREQACLSLLMCDVDFFKAYNDQYGHQAGDECLLKIAQTIDDCMRRSGDFVARYGGEEFVVILPHTPLTGAQTQADIIQSHLQALALVHPQSSINDYVTVSIGIASGIPKAMLSPDQIIERADAALYQAKAQGRNRSYHYKF